MPGWFAFIKDRGVKKGDEIIYRVRPEGLRSVYRSAAGQVLLDRFEAGRKPTLGMFASYFAPGSDFRELLIKSLFK